MKRNKRHPVLAAAPGLAFAVILTVSVPVFGAEPGWFWQEDGWHYYLEDGSSLSDAVTPDGYYMNPDGTWYERTESILETDFKAPFTVPHPLEEWNGKEALEAMKTRLDQNFSGKRSFRIGDNAVEFVKIETVEKNSSLTGGRTSAGSFSGSRAAAADKAGTVKETVLLGLYREPGQGRYRLDIRAALDGERAGSSRTASCNYEVFRAMVFQVSSAPEILADALYSAWEEENLRGIGREQWTRIGDCEVKYGSGDGYGRFYIRPVGQEN